jgi:hypothetical protein
MAQIQENGLLMRPVPRANAARTRRVLRVNAARTPHGLRVNAARTRRGLRVENARAAPMAINRAMVPALRVSVGLIPRALLTIVKNAQPR